MGSDDNKISYTDPDLVTPLEEQRRNLDNETKAKAKSGTKEPNPDADNILSYTDPNLVIPLEEERTTKED